MKIYAYAIILHPTKEQAEQGTPAKLIVDPTWTLAKDDSQAAMLAGRAIPQEHLAHLDRLEVAISPF